MNDKLKELIMQHALTETYTLPDGTKLVNVHSRTKCEGRHCVIHNQSGHHMREYPLVWNDASRFFERVCPHGVRHPDPDGMAFQLSLPTGDDGWAVHGCDGCCEAIMSKPSRDWS